MKERLLIFLALISLIVILIGLNAASFVQKEKVPDSEGNPNRSTYNFGATGTRALYDLLAETGRKTTRWQQPTSALLSNAKNKPATFVIIGKTRRELEDREIAEILRWVEEGGKLVVIDREPAEKMMKTTASWIVSVGKPPANLFFDADSSDARLMTEKTVAAKPIQPSTLTSEINAVQPSRFASTVNVEYVAAAVDDSAAGNAEHESVIEPVKTPPPAAPPVEAPPVETVSAPKTETVLFFAPVIHLANDEKNLLVDFPYGSGEIVYLTDPYIVSNAGIQLVDNAQLAVNIVASREGIIAFDEYHQGFGAENNQLLAYFAGTPVAAIFLQLLILVGLLFFSQSRRFARALPETAVNRLSKLEYVSAMAELQRRTGAFDLAIENIYSEFRRRVARLVGVDNSATSHRDLAVLIAERAELNRTEVEVLLFKCEDIIRGEPTGRREVLRLTARLREIEEKLGLKRTARQIFKK